VWIFPWKSEGQKGVALDWLTLLLTWLFKQVPMEFYNKLTEVWRKELFNCEWMSGSPASIYHKLIMRIHIIPYLRPK